MLLFLKENLWKILLGLNYTLVIVVSFIIVLKNRNPVKTLSYLFALAVLPFLGLLVYYFFGQDYRKDKIFKKKYLSDNTKLKKWREELALDSKEKEDFEDEYGPAIYKIYRLLRNNEKAVLTFNNSCQIQVNGEEKYKTLRKDLLNAKHHIHLEYFVLVDDKLGGEIIDILCNKAQKGVKVRLIYDDVGSSISSKSKKLLTSNGVEHFPFMPVLFSNFTSKINYRNHRKIIVIDGEVGYVGGINIEQKYDNSFVNKRFWRDTHVRLEGEAVGSLQASFLLNWSFVSNGKPEIDNGYFPKPHKIFQNPKAVQIASSGPDSDWANIMEAIFSLINSAREYLFITTPYLIPNSEILTSIKTAARSGVDVKILIPWKSDSWAAQYASDSYIEQLLESGVRIFRYKKGFIHAKSMVSDNRITTIGTANLDYRSFAINFEINSLIYDRELAMNAKEIFQSDLVDSEEVDLERWKNRSIRRKLQESFSRLWAPLL
ncbi:cardiolipin synthase [Saonia flava]|uniref:Cardiolipin synthase n=1 Tax=Saonia flava TaxID=523696 RepID=A0A846QUX5_9FLAO|nr:cardiolipin synthase [Saonia flava]NJB72051.1 cardiolipin synthase [Saonia flava]